MPVHLLRKKQGNGCFLLYTEPPRGYIVTNDTCATREDFYLTPFEINHEITILGKLCASAGICGLCGVYAHAC